LGDQPKNLNQPEPDQALACEYPEVNRSDNIQISLIIGRRSDRPLADDRERKAQLKILALSPSRG